MRLSIIGLVALGLVAAFSAALLVTTLEKPVNAASSQQGEPADVKVLVAKRALAAVTIVEADDFEQRTVAKSEAPEGHLSNPLQVVGKPLRRPMVEGQAFTEDCFSRNTAGLELVAALPAGKRAVTVDLQLASGLEGLLYPGSVVDVLASFELKQNRDFNAGSAVATTLLQSVEILAIDEETIMTSQSTTGVEDVVAEKKNEDRALNRRKTRRVTFGVTPKQAEALQLAAMHGTVSLAMRNPHDREEANTDATVLSGGRLANLAEYLAASVPDEKSASTAPTATEEPAESASPPVAPAPAPAAAAPPRRELKWDVTVMRGTDVEVRSFTQEMAEAAANE